jgi:hypothetical protein
MKKVILSLLLLLGICSVQAANTVPKNRANNQICLTLGNGEKAYYNTSQISSVIVGDTVVVNVDETVQDVYAGNVSSIAFAKKSVENVAVNIAFNGTTASITGDTDVVTVSQNGADITVTSTIDCYLDITLTGSTTSGSLIVYSQKKYGITLNGVSITNPQGPAINNQCGKSLHVTLADGTVNTLTDGASYAESSIDQKGVLFSEGQIYFLGTGTLQVNGNAKNGIASDDYIVIEGGTIKVDVAETGSNGIKVNDGFTISGGVLGINVKADGARGIKSDAQVEIQGGETTITTKGDCLIETTDGVRDTASAAGVKCDGVFLMTAGKLTVTSTGDGGKGINCADTVKFEGGTLVANTTGSNDEGKPKAVKGDKGIIVSGGSFTATCKKSWALDNGVDSETVSDRVTIIGTPTTKTLEKRNVIIKYE